jgi:hypothetical protein
MNEIEEISDFVHKKAIVDSPAEMETQLDLAIGYSQRIGELLNEAERAYSIKKADSLNKLRDSEDETETTRKAKLDAWVAEDKKLWKDLKNIQTHLKQRIMSLFQAIKTRRGEFNR